jgi:hypothetical protein
MSVRNESLSRDQNVRVPVAAGPLDDDAAGAGVLAVAGADVVDAGCGADDAADGGAEDAAGVEGLLDEQAALNSARARLAEATPAHRCLAFISCLTFP